MSILDKQKKYTQIIKRQYNLEFREDNYKKIILKQFSDDRATYNYFKRFMDDVDHNVDILWAKLNFLFIMSVKERDVEQVKRYYKLLNIYPKNFYNESIMADIYLRYYGDIFKAKDKYFNAIELKNNDYNAYYNLGYVYHLLGIFEKAAEYYELCAKNCTRSKSALLIKAKSLYNVAVYHINITGQADKAKKLLERSLKAYPQYENAQSTLEILKGALKNEK